MASIPADALMDEEMENREIADAPLKRRSLPTLSEFAKPEKKLAGARRMCEDAELVPIKMPKEYKKSKYIDRVSGDVLLLNPPPSKKRYTFLDGNFLVVECKLYGRRGLWEKVHSVILDEPYEGSESEGKTVIDLIELNCLMDLPPPPSDETLRKYLNFYMDCLEKVNGAKEMPDREKVIGYLVTHRKDIDFFMGSNAMCRNLEGSVVCAHYKNGRSEAPTVLYINHGIKIEE